MFIIETIILFFGILLFFYYGIPIIYVYYKKDQLQRKVYRKGGYVLTFDDGPSPEMDDMLLPILSRKNIHAAFFLLGRNVVKNKERVSLFLQEGHDVFSHGYDHINHWTTSPWRSIQDIKKGWEAIHEALGPDSPEKYPVRPPFGKLNLISLLYLKALKIPVVFWTFDSRDTWSHDYYASQHCERFRKESSAVILVHDIDWPDANKSRRVLNFVEGVMQIAEEKQISFRSIKDLELY